MVVHSGEALIDFVPSADAEGNTLFRPVVGGSPLNTAVATARLGCPAAFLGTVSTDLFGDRIVAHLQENGVDTASIRRSDRPSTLAFVERQPDGSARYAFFADGAADRDVRPEHAVLPEGALALQIGSISLLGSPSGETIVSLAEAVGETVVVSLDPNIRPGLVADEATYRALLSRAISAATIVKISDEDLRWLGHPADESGMAAILAMGPDLVLMTRGADGALAATAAERARTPAPTVEVADTIGAGDSFHGAVLAWLRARGLLSRDAIGRLGADDLEQMLSCAVTVAALTCARHGADPPRKRELAGGACAGL